MSLQPIPAPGLAVFPQYVSDKQESFKIKGEAFSRDFEITHADGRPFLHMETAVMSLSSRKTIRDAASGQMICQMRSSGFGGSLCAETDDGKKLFDVTKESMGTSRFTIQCGNANAGGRVERLDYKSDSHWNPRDGTISWQGRPVAQIEKNVGFISKASFVVNVAPGLDPFIAIGLLIAIEDKRRKRRSGAAAGAGGGGGC